MKISKKWLQDFITVPEDDDKLEEMLTSIGLEVEDITKYSNIKSPTFEGLVVGKVLSKEKHPDADRLNLTVVEIGHGVELKIVCGAKNVEVNQKVIVATIGAVLYPIEGEPFTIKESKIRGQISQGMICAEDEIGLGTSHDGILVLDSQLAIGTPISEIFPAYHDTIFELNITPNRVDASNHLGVARDLAAKSNQKINYKNIINRLPNNHNALIEVIIEDFNLCPIYSGIVIKGIQVKESPEWLKNRLKSIGLKPINNIVDATNYILFETGQPLHAFDLEKIKGNKIVVKKSVEGEKFVTLDGKERILSGNELMICNQSDPMVMAGVYGGLDSGVNLQTTDIFIESAYFNPEIVRKSSRYHQLFTDSAFRFERGTDPNFTLTALNQAIDLILEIAGGKIEGNIVSNNAKPFRAKELEISFEYIWKVIGKEIPKTEILNILKALEIKILSHNANEIILELPSYKPDVIRKIDIVEEILRIYGLDNIEVDTKINSVMQSNPMSGYDRFRNDFRKELKGMGFFEAFHLSFASPKDTNETIGVKMMNPLGKETEYLRSNYMLSGLESIERNINRKQDRISLYEIGFEYQIIDGKFIETEKLGIWISGNENSTYWNKKSVPFDFYYAKSIVALVLDDLKSYLINYTENEQFIKFGKILFESNTIGLIGEIHPNILKERGIKNSVFYVEVDLHSLYELKNNKNVVFRALNKYPSIERDLSFVMKQSIKFADIQSTIQNIGGEYLKEIYPFDVFEGKSIGEGKKSYGVRLKYESQEKTLKDFEIDRSIQEIVNNLVDKFQIELRS